MRTAIIDLGTNSVRFDVYQVGPESVVRRLHREKIMIRLGQEVFSNGRLSRAAVERSLAAFQRFKRLGKFLKVKKTVAFATSALREAHDRESFQNLIREKCEVELKVISGKEEARLIALGILSHERLPSGRFALIDIGGGSTEISICEGQTVLHSHSFSLGTARLEQFFLKSIPPAPEQVKALRLTVCQELVRKIKKEGWPEVSVCLGSSGTVRALSRISKKLYGHSHVAHKKLEALNKKMSRLTAEELLLVPGMEPKRVDMILSGSLILEEAMAALGAKKVIPTEFSLRDGILETVLKSAKPTSVNGERALEPFYDHAKTFGKDEKDLKNSVKVAELLFQKLRPLHQLSSSWKDHLLIATLLKDTGQLISPNRHEEHSYYIVKNSDLPFAMEWEKDLVANLCRYHGASELDSKAMKAVTHHEKKGAFLKLLALLRMVGAVDLCGAEGMPLKTVSVKRSVIELAVKKNILSQLSASPGPQQPGGLIQKVLGRDFRVVEI